MAAVASSGEDVSVELKGKANNVLPKATQLNKEIHGTELLATVAAIRGSGEQLRGNRIVLFLDNNAAAGALAKVPIILATTECFWAPLAQPPKSR